MNVSSDIRRAAVLVAVVTCLALAGCQQALRNEQHEIGPVPNVVTADIQAGIEKHIEEWTLAGGGYFKLSYGDKDLSLKLVRVHTEYLANLGPRRHFACVDLVDTLGDVYDVDFFLSGDPGAMRVTETTAHKFNGQPFYTWEQNRDGTWARAPIQGALPRLLGVVTGADEFEFLYRATLPEITDIARMWLPLAATDAFQTVEVQAINTPGTRRVLEDPEYGNKILFLALGPQDSGKHIEILRRV